MKRQLFTVCALMTVLTAGAQNAYDAERLAGSELNGTARFVGMGGAMSALGGDISVIGTNPAGLGIFRSNDVSMSFGFNNTSVESTFQGFSNSQNRTRASFDQIGFVYSTKIGNQTSLRYVNFGFNYHKKKNFNRVFSSYGSVLNQSQSWDLADELQGISSDGYYDILDSSNPYSNTKYSPNAIQGVLAGLVDIDNETGDMLGWGADSKNYRSWEKGGISEYDFSVAFNVEDRFYFGATIGAYDVRYNLFSTYNESVNDADGTGDIWIDNDYRLEGTGVDLKLGAIVRPIEESPFRIGLAVHTPTWYDLTEYSSKTMETNINLTFDYFEDYAYVESVDYPAYDYRLNTPWTFNVSAGTTVSNMLAVGAEYEFEDYSTSKFKDYDGYDLDGNYDVKSCLKGVHTFRVGMEAKLAPEFSFRVGYNYSSAAYKNNYYSEVPWYGASSLYNNGRTRNTVTFGLGYRGSVVYADLAYKYDAYKSSFYGVDDVKGSQPVLTSQDQNRHQLLFTLGARF
jgi:hypothetical protein